MGASKQDKDMASWQRFAVISSQMTTSHSPKPLSLRIDSAIKVTSYLHALLYSSLMSSIILLAWLAKLSLWHYVLILIVAAIVIGYLALSKPILLHISQPPLSKRVDIGWQLMMRTSRADELWQAKLATAYHYPWLIHLSFIMAEPYQRPFSATIFRDQVSAEHWRQLSILANSIDKAKQNEQADSKFV